MKRNLLALLLLLVSCALAARFLRPPEENPEWNPMRKHMESCLNVFWGTPNNAVQFVAGAGGNPEAWVTAFSPPGISPQREHWNFALLRFVATRHGGLKLAQLNVTNGTTGIRLQPDREGPVVGNPDQAGMAELLRRQEQGICDQRYGPNRVLVLVEATSPPVDLRQQALISKREHVNIWLVHFKETHLEASPSTERIVELPEP